MLKLKRIINGKSSAPELFKIKIYNDCIYAAGGLYTIYNGETVNDLSGHARFIPIESYDGMGDKEEITGFYVTTDMVFDVDYYPSSLILDQGSLVNLDYDNDALGMIREDGSYEGIAIVVGPQNKEKCTVPIMFLDHKRVVENYEDEEDI